MPSNSLIIFIVFVSVAITYIATRMYIFHKINQQARLVKLLAKKSTEYKQIEMHLFLAKILIAYLIICLALTMSRLL